MNVIIGIGGHKNCGKDLVANIFAYINYVGINQSSYHDWQLNHQEYEITLKNNIVHFADALKDNLSVIFDIRRDLFDDRYYKDNCWYDFRINDFILNKWLTNEHHKLFIDDFKSLDSFKKLIADNPERPCIKLRTLMQVYGQLMRDIFGDDIWATSAIRKASKIALYNKIGLIADVRYINEVIAIKSCNSSMGYVVRIFRDVADKNDIIDNHESEQCMFDYDFKINNNTTLVNLFYQCFNIYKQIYENSLSSR